MPSDTTPRPQIRVRGRSFMAFVMAPEPPLARWLAELDVQMLRSPGFFEARPVVIDFGALTREEPGIGDLIAALESRGLSVIDVENAEDIPSADPWCRRLVGGRESGEVELAAEPPPATAEDNALIIPENVRSGQSVAFLQGDVTVVGSVSSGAEVLSGGSIHIYGTLRGRALAGAVGNSAARIFYTPG
eukprot:gene5809-5872_t